MLDVGVYYVTGGLGSGKSAAVVTQIKQGLIEGRRIVTNLDLTLENLVGPNAKESNVLRIPDHPTIEDLEYIGNGYDDPDPKNYDESRFGIIALDELGTWFNSREWNKPGRREVVNWLLHARKRRWILMLIIQDLDLLDSQARAATAKDFVVYCSNMSKYSVPILNPLYKLITGKRLSFPTFHLAIVKNGLSPTALVSDRWVYSTKHIRTAYNTRQLFLPTEAHDAVGMNTVLTPWLTTGRYIIKKDWSYYMAELQKKSHWGFLLAGIALFFSTLSGGFAAGLLVKLKTDSVPAIASASNHGQSSVNPLNQSSAKLPDPVITKTDCTQFLQKFSNYRISGSYGGRSFPVFMFEDGADGRMRSYMLEREGYDLKPSDQCTVQVK